MMRIFGLIGVLALLVAFQASPASAIGHEDFNDCKGTQEAFCERSGSCAIQGSAWYQYVTIDTSERFKTMGWPGVCDMVHVSLVQGNCEPLGSQLDVTSYLSPTTSAQVPAISGTLVCGGDDGGGGEPTGSPEGKGRTCTDGIDNDLDGATDCGDNDCARNRACR